MSKPSLSKLLKHPQKKNGADHGDEIKELQLRFLRIQQGLWHRKERAIFVFEGFDAAGKGGAIRTLTEPIDPRGVRVHPIGPPTSFEQGKHYLYRFWKKVPSPGTIAVFDRSWYGRVLIERVEKLVSKERIEQAYQEINEFERQLVDDGVHLVKLFLGVSEGEQLKRYEDRLNDPYKRWKLTEDDLRARKKWKDYVESADRLFKETHRERRHWHLIPSDSKSQARVDVLRIAIKELQEFETWMETEAARRGRRSLKEEMKALKRKG